MLPRLFAPIFLLLAVAASAEVVSPELIPLKQGYDAKIEELVRIRATSIAGKTEAYLKLLAEAEAGATDAKAVEAIKRERAGVAGGLLAPAMIPDLPADVAAAHRAFFGSVARDSLAYTNAKKPVVEAYTKALQSLSAKFRKNALLLKEIAAERHRALYRLP